MYVIVFVGEQQRAAHVYSLAAAAKWIKTGNVFISYDGMLYPVKMDKAGQYGFWVRGTWKKAPKDTYR